ncbi:hypothetical protein D0864_10170 [Hortaea werneckii]|uniref:CFEM domain-containing protein n=1 Tax=Hortaea werneckii TaxID=91943 RepID=A0A3M7EAP1_HORWE|nr:hypothetical protein D0864_10170 [Hortaea werneckii]
MRLFSNFTAWLPVLAIVPVLSLETSTGPDQKLLQLSQELPTCAANCLMALMPQSACPMDDLQCICSNQELQSRVQTCLASSCTIRQILGMQFRILDLAVSANKFYSRKETTVYSVRCTHT